MYLFLKRSRRKQYLSLFLRLNIECIQVFLFVCFLSLFFFGADIFLCRRRRVVLR